MEEKRIVIEIIREFIKKNEKINKKTPFNVLNEKFVVFPNVYSPTIFQDTEFYVNSFKYQKDVDFCEIGCGTGVISLFWALNGAKSIVATDINPNAIANTVYNFKLHNLSHKLHTFESDMYNSIPATLLFDIIFWNIPFVYTKTEASSLLDKSVFDYEYNNLEKFFKYSSKYLKRGGYLLFSFSKSCGHFDQVDHFSKKFDWDIEKLNEKKLEVDTLGCVSVELYKAIKRRY